MSFATFEAIEATDAAAEDARIEMVDRSIGVWKRGNVWRWDGLLNLGD